MQLFSSGHGGCPEWAIYRRRDGAPSAWPRNLEILHQGNKQLEGSYEKFHERNLSPPTHLHLLLTPFSVEKPKNFK